MDKKNRKQYSKKLLICAAFVILALDILFVFIPDKEYSETENRNLQQFPKVSFSTVTGGRFENQMDKYIADQFPFRNAWVGLQTFISRLEGTTISNDIFLGKDGYLIQRFHEPTKEEYQKKLKEYKDVIDANQDKNIYALIVPTAVTILKDKLPLNAKGSISGDENSYIDRMYEDLRELGVTTVDVRDTLLELADAEVQVYYRTDHHWTTDAAYKCYDVFAAKAGVDKKEVLYEKLLASGEFKGTLTASSGFKSSETDSLYVYLPVIADEKKAEFDYVVVDGDTGEKSASVYDTSFLDTRDKYALFFGGNHGVLTIRSKSESGKNLLIIKDSYANCFVPFMIWDYSKIVMVDPRYNVRELDEIIAEEGVTDILFLNNANVLS